MVVLGYTAWGATPMKPAQDRRQAPRYAVTVQVTFESEHNFFTGLTQDLSKGGLFVATPQMCPIGTRVKLRMILPTSSKPIDVLTEVRWLRTQDLSNEGGKAGVGLMFLQMSPEAAAAVQAYLAQRESIYFDAD
jgi:uncharacterized protein (TIGR02266 family)